MSSATPTVVVGYDGTPASRAAVVRGIERVREGGRLIIAACFDVPAEYVGLRYEVELLEDAADAAARKIDDLVDAEPRLEFVTWERVVVKGDPAHTLCRLAADRDADEIILGTRGLDRLGALLGSVAGDVLHLADRPVTVIPARMLAAQSTTPIAAAGTVESD